MYQGFYNLASGMLTQSRNLNVISNNMVNVQTAGYKSDTMVSTTFGEEMLYRTGRQNKENPEALASVSKIKAADRTYVSYEQGSFEQTGGIYDFSLAGNGFFCIQTARGERYTRNGSFCVDEEGYLALEDQGRVLSADGQPIQIQDENRLWPVAERREWFIFLRGSSQGYHRRLHCGPVAEPGALKCGYGGRNDCDDVFPACAAECGPGA